MGIDKCFASKGKISLQWLNRSGAKAATSTVQLGKRKTLFNAVNAKADLLMDGERVETGEQVKLICGTVRPYAGDQHLPLHY